MWILKKVYHIFIHEGFAAVLVEMPSWIFGRYFLHLRTKKEMEKAARYGERLIRLFPNKQLFYQWLAKCYKELGKEDLAKSTLLKGLEKRVSIAEIIEVLGEKMNPAIFLESKYLYLGGEQNLGCIEHRVVINGRQKVYLTKISPRVGFENEKLFYNKLYHSFRAYREITPQLINFTEFIEENLLFITMEKMDGLPPAFNQNNIEKMIQAHNLMTSVRYKELIHCLPKQNLNRQVKLLTDGDPTNPIRALHSFASIHTKLTNQQIFQYVDKRMKELNYSLESTQLLTRLEKVIVGKELFNKINPATHYSLQHGDFNDHNMLLEEKSEKLYLIDWGNLAIGPRWIDMAGFLGQLKHPFHRIKNDYLLNPAATGDFESIEKLFFIYTLIITWFIVFEKNEFDQLHDLYIRPALEMVEALALEVEKNEGNDRSMIKQKV
ncbi:thiamine kinase-like enzyme [Cytobacillus eiseniae]|uniref:Thiamine kinase-like enzyme n=1 Tax=Cytobacillus eiseniae TaxID=762947 RepID=A0ABS4RG28_9BACI|nr:phosphotransferase [Cytobacillus eiseniae]MBP2241863.1 thiamine kinase-like enzyme [Cytobacillus eiseniae]